MKYNPVLQIHKVLLYSFSLILSFQVRLLASMKLEKLVEATHITPRVNVDYLRKLNSQNTQTLDFTLRNLITVGY
jgi:hypothetical protein